MKKETLLINGLAIFACLLWSSAFTGVKIGLEYSTPLRFAGIRFFFAGLLLIPLARRKVNYLRGLRTHFWKILYVASLQIIAQYILFYYGLSMVSGTLGAIIIGSGPLFIALFAHFSIPDDRLNLKKILIVLFGFSGIVLVSIGRHPSQMDTVRTLGVLLLVAVNISSGFVNVFIKKRTGNIPPLIMSSASMILGGFVIFMLSMVFEPGEFKIQPPIYYIALSWLTLLSAAAFSIWFYLLAKPAVKVSDLNFWKFLIPVVGAIIAWLFLPNESPDSISIIGVSITGISLVLLNLVRRKLL